MEFQGQDIATQNKHQDDMTVGETFQAPHRYYQASSGFGIQIRAMRHTSRRVLPSERRTDPQRPRFAVTSVSAEYLRNHAPTGKAS